MNFKRVSFVLAACFASFSTLAGCAADTSSEPGEEDSEVVETGEDAITGAPSNFGYFVVTRRDQRRCLSPVCGGYFVKRVNQATTRCGDGTLQAECYVSAIQLGRTGLSALEQEQLLGAAAEGRAVLKAATYKKSFNGTPIGLLKASEGWLGATGSAPAGSFYRAADNGIRCIKAPCPSTTAYRLNGRDDHNVINVLLENTAKPASPESLDRARQAIGTREGVLVAGSVAIPRCLPNASCGPLLLAQEFFIRMTRTEGNSCGGFRAPGFAGCNADQFCQWSPGDICGAADAPGRCQYKPSFCAKNILPVCGCDGKTYNNACEAGASGMSVVAVGACQK